MDLDLKGRSFLITGGSSGLGFGMADVLAGEGANVAICGRDTERLSAAEAQLRRHGGDVLATSVDVTDAAQLDAFVDAAGRRWGRLDGLVNNAGSHTGKPFLDATDGDWQADFELKVLAAIRAIRSAVPWLRLAEGGASVVTVLSVYARFQPAESMPSSMFRSAGLALTKGLSNELAGERIRVNALLAGYVHSGQYTRAADSAGVSVEEIERRVVEHFGIPLGRMGKTDELADLAAFILSPRAGYITGTSIAIDGGLSPMP